MSTLRVNAITDAAGTGNTAAAQVGVGQTWQSVIGSRSLNNNFTNTTGRPIIVQIMTSQGAASISRFNMGSGTPVTFIELGTPSVNGQCPMPSIVVPAGWSYSVTVVAGTVSVVYWWELR